MADSIVLVPLDGSKNSEPALAAARVLAEIEGARLRVIYALDQGQDHSPLETAQESFARYGAGLCDTYGLAADRTSFEVVEGSPARTILSESENATWIAIASHGRGGFKATVIGSVADKVVRGARVPVWLVPGVETSEPVKPTRILVCLDGSDEAERGLEVARKVAAAAGAALTLIQTVSTVLPVAGELAYYPPELPETLLNGAEEYLAGVAKPGERTIARQGFAASEIVAMAEELDSDLVVMTASGKGLAARLALGSTTDRVMHSLHRPMVIVPSS